MELNIKIEDANVEKMLQRFIKYAESNMTSEPNDDKIVTIESLRKKQKESDPSDDYLNNIALHVGDAIFGIIILKVSIVTGETIDSEDSKIPFEEVFNMFKDSITHAEEIYKAENVNLYEMPLFTVIDAITTVTSHKIIDAYFFKQPSSEESKQ